MSNYSPPSDGRIPHEMIALRAYHLWKSRGCPVGDEQRDWYAARAELECELTVPGNSRYPKKAA
jgi:hypothetical protein